ncbi:MAG: hypothetical protein ACRC6E_10370 [Fusobacteriaceae bacterium]
MNMQQLTNQLVAMLKIHILEGTGTKQDINAKFNSLIELGYPKELLKLKMKLKKLEFEIEKEKAAELKKELDGTVMMEFSELESIEATKKVFEYFEGENKWR